MSLQTGVLYIVATPLGNLGDMTFRAVEILNQVDVIAAEDTRHSRKLLDHYGVKTPLVALHEHNEQRQLQSILAILAEGKQLALISDAGTPLISDPGFALVREARTAGYKVVPIPGPSALITALSVAGLPTDRFVFEGFLPAKAVARQNALMALQYESRTLVFYEAPHRILETLEDMSSIFGADRPAVLGRELTKTYETVLALPLKALRDYVAANKEQQLGEMVILIHGAIAQPQSQKCEIDVDELLRQLLSQMTVKSAAHIAATITGLGKNTLYDKALRISQSEEEV